MPSLINIHTEFKYLKYDSQKHRLLVCIKKKLYHGYKRYTLSIKTYMY